MRLDRPVGDSVALGDFRARQPLGNLAGDAPLGAKLIDLGEQIRVATGVDLPKLMQDRLGSAGASPDAKKPPPLPRRPA